MYLATSLRLVTSVCEGVEKRGNLNFELSATQATTVVNREQELV
jgi:hypothetical protein